MSTNALVCSAFALLSMTSLLACVGEDMPLTTSASPTVGTPAGERGGPCYANQTCNEGLACEDGIVCVTSKQILAGDAGPAPKGTADAAPTQCKKTGSFAPPIIKPPAPKSASCTDSQIAQLADACFLNPNGPDCMVVRGQFFSCASCAFGSTSDAQWKPILGSDPPVYNVAGCVDLASNVSGCGPKYGRIIACFDRYCDECGGGAAEAECQKAVAEDANACKPYLIDQTCGMAVDNAEKQCFPADASDGAIRNQFVAMVTVACK